MSRKEEFQSIIKNGYDVEGDSIILGGAKLDGESIPETFIKLPLRTMNRHGLIAGATGTGKTKTLQIIAENLSRNSVPVLLMDVKGDLSGLGAPGKDHPKIDERHKNIGIPYEPKESPLEFLSLSEDHGLKLRATVSEFGPILFSKMLELNDTQSGICTIIFKYCDDNGYPLLDLKDFKKMLQYVKENGKKEIENEYGRLSGVSVSTILRKVIELEQQGADVFFGEPSFDVEDLCRTNNEGQGIISVLRLTDIQDKPKLFSTFMLCLLSEIYSIFPEEGDLDAPKLVIFIDEAHLIFKEASDALLDQLETIIKLIRSKGVGIFFCTQNPTDIPDAVLSQLGLKVQHALRAFTAKDRKNIKKTAENYPITEFYKTDQLLTELGIGEAIVSVLDEKGRPSPLAHTLLRAPMSRMDVLSTAEINTIIKQSKIRTKYNKVVDRESAYEILTERMEYARRIAEEKAREEEQEKEAYKRSKSRNKEKSVFEEISKNTMVRQIGRTLAREIGRGLLGVLGVKRRR